MSDYKKNFRDYTAEELIGKVVLNEYGTTYNASYGKKIASIVKVTKTGFKITNDSSLFSLVDGDKKGMSIGSRNTCYLITDEQADNLRKEWKEKRLKKEFLERINSRLLNCSLDTLTKINTLLFEDVEGEK